MSEMWTWRWLDAIALDLRYAMRSLLRSRGFTLGTGAVLAIAIGTNVALFSFVNGILLRPLPYPDAERVVRTREIGVRMAIGAAARDISQLILREGMRPVAVGLAAGLAAALAANRILQSQLVGVSPYDPLVLIATPTVLVGVALAACLIPLRRALRIEAAVALRHE